MVKRLRLRQPLLAAVVALTNRSGGVMPQYIANWCGFLAVPTINSTLQTKTHAHRSTAQQSRAELNKSRGSIGVPAT